jgi:hypothetical protein
MSRDTLANPLSPPCDLVTLSRSVPSRVSHIIQIVQIIAVSKYVTCLIQRTLL